LISTITYVGNIVDIDVKDRGSPQYVQYKYYKPAYVQDKDCKMDIIESITFWSVWIPYI
jgi:hypothetical protein